MITQAELVAEGCRWAEYDSETLLKWTEHFCDWQHMTPLIRRPEWDEFWKFPVYLTKPLTAKIQDSIDEASYRSWQGFARDFYGASRYGGWEYAIGWRLIRSH